MCCGNGNSALSPSINNRSRKSMNIPVLADGDCPFSNNLLLVWLKSLQCVKNTKLLQNINLTIAEANAHLGNIQSALNHPGKYCNYLIQLTDFQNNVLPKIIENVPWCIQ